MVWLIIAAVFLGFWVMIITGLIYTHIEESRAFRQSLTELLENIVLVPCEDETP